MSKDVQHDAELIQDSSLPFNLAGQTAIDGEAITKAECK